MSYIAIDNNGQADDSVSWFLEIVVHKAITLTIIYLWAYVQTDSKHLMTWQVLNGVSGAC